LAQATCSSLEEVKASTGLISKPALAQVWAVNVDMWRVLALSFTLGYAAHTEPVNLHAVNAAEAAEVAKQAATVAKRVAAHTEDVAHDTAAALRFTRDALKRAGANADDVAEVGRQADRLEAEAGTKSSESSENSQRDASSTQAEESEERTENSQRDGSSTQSEESDKSSSKKKSSKLEKGSSNHINRDSSSSGGSSGGSSDGSSSDSSSSGSSSSGSSSSSGGRSLDVNSDIVPYPNGVEPFGQEAPAKELTEESVKQSDGMVDQIENAQGVEAKRSVYRALTKLRGATIASYDGIAKGHLKNVDHYNKGHKWREDHPMRHLAEEEADTHIWAFPKHSSKTAPKAVKKKAKKAAAGAKKAASPAAAPAAASAPAAAK